MAFRKQLPKPPTRTVREMVTKYGDEWYLFSAADPISSPVWQGDMRRGDYHDPANMRRMEKGELDRVPDWHLEREEDMRPPVQVDHVFPPIPDRSFDYAAYREGYDGAPDSHCLIGHGPTPFAAINDLIEQESE